ncbi:MAG: S8 family serine peptidase, partial [Oscillatoriales cyanobacterium RU_3_3]|nr:S8 family serine peptidase [Oscillatoriales cyanobacterium RU_3_3]
MPTGTTTAPTAEADTPADAAEKSPVEKTPVTPAATEVKDPANPPVKSPAETEVAATTPTEKVETKPEVLPAESKQETEVIKTATTEIAKSETPKESVVGNTVDSAVKDSLTGGSIERQETAEVKPDLSVQETSMPAVSVNKGEELQAKETVTETEIPDVSDVTLPKDSQPNSQIVEETTENNSTAVTVPTNPENANQSIDLPVRESEIDFSVSAALIARLESMKQSLNDSRSADDPSQGSNSQDWIDRLNKLTEKLLANESATVSDKTVALVEKLKETIDRLIQPPIQPTLPSIETARFDFPVENQPTIGIIDTGFAGNNPDIDYSRITWGQDRVDGDTDPRIEPGQGNEHGTHVLGIIAATQNNGIGIEGINEQAPIWAGRAIGSGKWAESVVEYVDYLKASGKKNGVINL